MSDVVGSSVGAIQLQSYLDDIIRDGDRDVDALYRLAPACVDVRRM